MSVPLANFAFEAVNFLLLAAGLGWVLFRPVKRVLQAEQARHGEERKRAGQLLSEAEARLRAQKDAQEAQDAALSQRRAAAQAALREELDAAREAAQKAREDEERRFQAERAEALRSELLQFSAAVGRVAARSVQHLLQQLQGPALDRALLKAALSQLRKLAIGDPGAVVLECARPLDAEAERWVREQVGGEVTKRVRPELGAGVRLVTAAGQIDCTALAIARQAAVEVGAGLAKVGGQQTLGPVAEEEDSGVGDG